MILNRAELISESPFKLKVTLEGKPKSINQLYGHHYHVKHNNATYWKSLMRMVIGYRIPKKPLESVSLSFTRHSERFLDYDGCVASFKPVCDALTELKIIKDDNYKITGPWKVEQFFRQRKLGSLIEVIVEERV
jgi:hypothetical protein